jgi:hypothetical protein
MILPARPECGPIIIKRFLDIDDAHGATTAGSMASLFLITSAGRRQGIEDALEPIYEKRPVTPYQLARRRSGDSSPEQLGPDCPPPARAQALRQ